jgi:hypothetical protein
VRNQEVLFGLRHAAWDVQVWVRFGGELGGSGSRRTKVCEVGTGMRGTGEGDQRRHRGRVLCSGAAACGRVLWWHTAVGAGTGGVWSSCPFELGARSCLSRGDERGGGPREGMRQGGRGCLEWVVCAGTNVVVLFGP